METEASLNIINQISNRIAEWAYGSIVFWIMVVIFILFLVISHLRIFSEKQASLKRERIEKSLRAMSVVYTIIVDLILILCIFGMIKFTYFLFLFPIFLIILTIIIHYDVSLHYDWRYDNEGPGDIDEVLYAIWCTICVLLIPLFYYAYFGFWFPRIF